MFGLGVVCSVYADAKVFVEERAVSGLPLNVIALFRSSPPQRNETIRTPSLTG
jgi:hypothetical protein